MKNILKILLALLLLLAARCAASELQTSDHSRSTMKTATREAALLVAAPGTLRAPIARIAAPRAASAAQLLTVASSRSRSSGLW